MLFSAPLFLLLFMPATVALYVIAPQNGRNALLLGASLLFYAWGEPVIVFVILASALIDFVLGRRIASGGPEARTWLAVGIAGNLSLLFVFKYADFALQSIEPLVGPLAHFNLVLPLGISFVIFEKITYLVDVHQKTSRPAASLQDYLLFVFFFPKMLAGPIIKFHEIERPLQARAESWDDRAAGFLRFLWGLARKVLVADVCGNLADRIFDLPAGGLGFRSSWIGVVAFTVQIYFDFAGYSDMAIGLARMFGFRLRENFNNPYGSASFTEFWRRWHISLSSWIRDYLYVPLGGSRGSAARTYVNLWTCFLLSGLWHGAAWTFVLWGAWNGIFLIADRLFWLRLTARLPRAAGVGVTLLLVMVGWAIFRARSFPQLQELLTAMMSPGSTGQFVPMRAHEIGATAIGLTGALLAATSPGVAIVRRIGASPGGRAVAALAAVTVGSLALLKAVTVTFNPFLYFRF
jgi:alginate O-acetyltransferase complex protein AlgI